MKHLLPVLFLFTCACSTQSGAPGRPEHAQASVPAGELASPMSVALNQLFNEYFERSLQLNPLQATFIGDHRYDDQLANNISPEEVSTALAVDREYLEAALEFDPATLSATDRLSWEIFVYERRTAIAAAAFPALWLPVNQLFSVPNVMPLLGSGTNAQPFKTTKDYENFLARMADFVVWADQAVTNMREGIRQGVVYPRVVMEQVQSQLAGLLVEDPVNSLFYRPAVNFPEAVPAADRMRLEAEYRSAITDQLGPSYRRLYDFVHDGLHTRGWTREQAIQYMLDNSSLADTDVKSEVERYIADPGQALGYKIGQIRIRELRNKAEAQLGARFDVKQFHSQILRDGALPMAVLEAKIDRWLEASRQR